MSGFSKPEWKKATRPGEEKVKKPEALQNSTLSKGPTVSSVPLGQLPKVAGAKVDKKKSASQSTTSSHVTVKRAGGGKKWEDKSLLEWDPSHFRLFIGNLSPEVTDQMLETAFAKYPSISKIKAVMDPKSGKNKGFGFVAFVDPEEYFKAFQEMNGKYIGNHPIQLKKANTEVKRSVVKDKRSKPYHRRQ
ncbi:hypothetical protein TRVA0_001S02850 [Trichomonascus vanleenenianus]|uniref:uncharacterized protein n=1 Tax=Trichomonascus vanleenenianus TaxID=2268995 RepID=UPI003EC9CF74